MQPFRPVSLAALVLLGLAVSSCTATPCGPLVCPPHGEPDKASCCTKPSSRSFYCCNSKAVILSWMGRVVLKASLVVLALLVLGVVGYFVGVMLHCRRCVKTLHKWIRPG
eukprot:scpid60927/ scgid0716/ 